MTVAQSTHDKSDQLKEPRIKTIMQQVQQDLRILPDYLMLGIRIRVGEQSDHFEKEGCLRSAAGEARTRSSAGGPESAHTIDDVRPVEGRLAEQQDTHPSEESTPDM